MSADQALKTVGDVAGALLYEGYDLSARQANAARPPKAPTFRGVFPQSFSVHDGGDPWTAHTQCLIMAPADAALTVRLRFLQLVVREMTRFDADGVEQRQPFIEVNGRSYGGWQEAIEHAVTCPTVSLGELGAPPRSMSIAFEGGAEREFIHDAAGRQTALIRRTRYTIQGAMVLSAQRIGPDLHRVTVRVENTTPLIQDECGTRALAQPGAFASSHVIMHVEGGAFVSLIYPPQELAGEAAACVQQGWWPVLAGSPGATDAMLVSPVMLYDYPQIAPESPAELSEIAAKDRHRHAAARPPIASLQDANRSFAVGERVRLRPRIGGDAMDAVLAGKVAVVEAVERDLENRVHVAVTVEDGQDRDDRGLERVPGHRFFFPQDELEPLGADVSP